MDIISLLITLIGIVIILGLYIIGRVSRNKLPQAQAVDNVPDLLDESGTRFTSVMDDIPARDGLKRQQNKTPDVNQIIPDTQNSNNDPTGSTQNSTDKQDNNKTVTTPTTTESQKSPVTDKAIPSQQLILFIAAKNASGLDGNRIHDVLSKHGLSLGDMDIYHYYYDHPVDHSKSSLFRVANGVAPWTLRPQDLRNQKLPGLSLMMQIPTPVDDIKAIEFYLSTAQKITTSLEGSLKNDQQQPFGTADQEIFLSRVEPNAVKHH